VQFALYPVAAHDFHLFWSFLPEAADALEQAGALVRGVHARAGAAGRSARRADR
jgi:epsilon-lactone hydrolase